jgi:hypothetical protein
MFTAIFAICLMIFGLWVLYRVVTFAPRRYDNPADPTWDEEMSAYDCQIVEEPRTPDNWRERGGVDL